MPRALIIYETRTGNTELMAKAIEAGLKEAGVEVELRRAGHIKADELREVDAIVLGSPTHFHNLFATMKTVLFEMEKLPLKDKVGAAFGSYGWSGEACGILTETMANLFEMDVLEPSMKIKKRPSDRDLEACRAFGRKIAEQIKIKG